MTRLSVATLSLLLTMPLASIASKDGKDYFSPSSVSSVDDGTGVKGNGDGSGGDCVVIGSFRGKDGKDYFIVRGKDGKDYFVPADELGSFHC